MGKRSLPLLLLLLVFGACTNAARLQEQSDMHMRMGTAYLASSQYNGALKELLLAEKLTPEDSRVHYLLGITYYGKRLDEKAVAEFQRAIALNPNDSESLNYLGAVYLDKGRWDDAIASFKLALSNILYDSPTATLYNMGRAYYEKGQYALAMKLYQDAAAKEPDSVLMPLIEKNMGMTALAKGDLEDAVRHLQKSIVLSPSLVESHYWLGMCYRQQGRSHDAAVSFQAAVRLAPESEYGRKAGDQLKITPP